MIIDGRSKESATFEARARVEGTLKEAKFQEGALVAKDQILFEIEKDQFLADLQAAEAQFDAANAQKTAAFAQVETAKAKKLSAEAASELAEAEFNRTKLLFDQKVATKSELDLITAKRAVAAAEIVAADATLNDADAAIQVADAAISREEARKEQAKIDLGYTTIHSEVEGLAGEILVDPGNIVGLGEMTLLTTVRQIDPLDIYFEAPERLVLQHLRLIYEGRREENRDVQIEVQFEGEEGYPHQGKLVLVDNRIDPDTGTTLLRGEIPNPPRGKSGGAGQKIPLEERRYLLRPGAYARIRVKTEPIPDAVLVHETAIGTDLSGKYLLIVNDKNEVEMRRVRLGQRYHEFRQIQALWKPDEAEPETTTAPVDTDFRYILSGILRARPGITVDIKEEVKLTYPEDEEAISEERFDEPARIETEQDADSSTDVPQELQSTEDSDSRASRQEDSEPSESKKDSSNSESPDEL